MARTCSALLCLLVLLTAAPGREIDVRVNSRPAGPAGLAVRVSLPDQGRYGAHAPVVVHVPGGWTGSEVARVPAPLATLGVIELRFAYPGEGRGAQRSGGRPDWRGPDSTHALADVVRFAAGSPAQNGHTLAELAAPLTPLAGEVGLLAWSEGGGVATQALARHAAELRPVAWLALWEAPYDDADATLQGDADWDRLAYDPTAPLLPAAGLAGVRGILYFDRNANGRYDPTDHAPLPAPLPGAAERYAYATELVRQAEARNLIAGRWPAHLAGSEQAAEYWAERTMAAAVHRAAVEHPGLRVMLLASQTDHLRPGNDHIVAGYVGWRESGAAWVRLNPDTAYLEAVAGPEIALLLFEAIPNLPLTGPLLRGYLAPDPVPDTLLAAAAVAELVDRRHHGRSDDLDAPLQATPTITTP